MRKNSNQTVKWVLIALVVICFSSLFILRSLNSEPKNSAPVIVAAATNGSVPSNVQNPLTTFSTTDLTESESKTEESTVSDVRETSATANTTKKEDETSVTEKETTTKAPTVTTQKVEMTDISDEQPNDVIKRAAVFSNGFLSYKYNAEEDYYYTISDPWQRQFGFNEMYDVGAPFLIFYYDTMRCKFNYNKKDWLVQFWKGQYGLVFIGGEIGVYNKPEGRTTEHYDCANDKDMLKMSLTMLRKGEEKFTRPYDKYWWCTGFVPGKLDNYSDRTELSLRAKITLKDQKMLNAFCESLDNNGLVNGIDYTTNGNDVYVSW